MRHKILLLVVAICMLFIGRSAFAAEQEPWWVSEIISAEGNGFAPRNIDNPEQAKLLAKEAARLDAYRKLAETAAGIHITANETIAKGEVNAVISGAKIAAEKYDEKTGRYTIIMQVPLYGVSNSISSAVFKNHKQEKTSQLTAPYDSDEEYTGIIIDCRNLTQTEKDALRPVLTPTFKTTDNQIVYDVNSISQEQLIKQGMVSYADEKKLNLDKAGKNPLVITPVSISDNHTNPVLTPLDGEKLRRAILKQNSRNGAKVMLMGLNVGAVSDSDGPV